MAKPSYSFVFKSAVLIDMIVQVTLWIAGAYTEYKLDELDQIIKFNVTESVFDILILSSLKALVLFILISELESVTIKIANSSATRIKKEKLAESATTSEHINTDQETLIESELSSVQMPQSSMQHRVYSCLIVFVTAACLIYTAIKFTLVLMLIVQFEQSKSSALPMDYYYFTMICIELGLCLIQVVIACFKGRSMRSLAAEIVLKSIENNTIKKEKKLSLKRLIALSHPERYLIFLAFINLMLSSVTTIVIPFFFGSVIDSATDYTDLKEMNKYIIYMFLIYLGGSLASGLRTWLFEVAGQRIVARLRFNVFSAIIKQDIEFFDTNRTGELTSRISSDTQVLQNAVTVNLSMLARYAIQILGSMLFMFSLQPSLTGLLLAIVPVVSLSTVQYGRFLKKLRKQFQDELAASSVIAEETISSARTVRSFAAEDKMAKNYKINIDKSYNIGIKLALATGGFMAFVGILTGGALSLVLWYGGKLVHERKITTGVLASFLMYTLQVAMAFAFLSSLYGDFMQALGASTRIFELLDRKPKIQSGIGAKPTDTIQDDKTFDGSLQFDKVDFTYSSRPESKILTNVSFKVDRGKCFAFVGPSGGGKSTIFSLIERFYDPDAGEIKLGANSVPISSVDTNWLHSQIALVAQEPVLLGGTIKENISFGLDEAKVDMEHIIEVSKLANAFEFISRLEEGFETVVGERGIRLSGGQKQRIAIARALLMNPKLLLLDEATSALDSESEHLVQEAIDRAMEARTVCVIAHRLSTVRNADHVVVIDKGSIVEQGSHDELCAIDGVYKKLVLRQLLNKQDVEKDSNEMTE